MVLVGEQPLMYRVHIGTFVGGGGGEGDTTHVNVMIKHCFVSSFLMLIYYNYEHYQSLHVFG